MKRTVFTISVGLVWTLVCGCGQRGPEISEYEEVTIASPAPPADPGFQHPPMGGSMSKAQPMPPPGGTPEGDPLTWTVPEGWAEEKGQGMRLATFLAEGEHGKTECSLITLSGPAGGLPANISRWIGQLGLDPLGPSELEAFIAGQPPFKTSGGEGVLIDLTTLGAGDDQDAASMMIGVVLRPGDTVFAKMMGSKAALQGERERLVALCESFN